MSNVHYYHYYVLSKTMKIGLKLVICQNWWPILAQHTPGYQACVNVEWIYSCFFQHALAENSKPT